MTEIDWVVTKEMSLAHLKEEQSETWMAKQKVLLMGHLKDA